MIKANATMTARARAVATADLLVASRAVTEAAKAVVMVAVAKAEATKAAKAVVMEAAVNAGDTEAAAKVEDTETNHPAIIRVIMEAKEEVTDPRRGMAVVNRRDTTATGSKRVVTKARKVMGATSSKAMAAAAATEEVARPTLIRTKLCVIPSNTAVPRTKVSTLKPCPTSATVDTVSSRAIWMKAACSKATKHSTSRAAVVNSMTPPVSAPEQPCRP